MTFKNTDLIAETIVALERVVDRARNTELSRSKEIHEAQIVLDRWKSTFDQLAKPETDEIPRPLF
jgi:hypothetical protein